jgi:hypothetical protein
MHELLIMEKDSEILQILSRDHQGVKFVFEYQAVIVGNNNKNNIALSDLFIELRHKKISFSMEGIKLKLLSRKVFVNGKLVRDPIVAIEKFSIITIDLTHIVIGPPIKRGRPYGLQILHSLGKKVFFRETQRNCC